MTFDRLFITIVQWFSTFLSWRTPFGADKAVSDPPKSLDKIYYFLSYSEVTKLVGNVAIAMYYNADYYDYSYTLNHKLHTGVCLMQKSSVK